MRYLRLKDVVLMFVALVLVLLFLILPQVKKYPGVPFGGGGGGGFGSHAALEPFIIGGLMDWLIMKGMDYFDRNPYQSCNGADCNWPGVNGAMGGGGGSGF